MKLFGALITLVVVGLLVAGYLLFKGTEADKVHSPTPNSSSGTTQKDPDATAETPVITPDRKSAQPGDSVRVTQQGDNVFSARGELVVKGTVRNHADRKPLAGVDVAVHDDDGDEMMNAKSGADGAYTITVNGDVPRHVEVTTQLEGYASEIAAGDVGAGEHREMTFDFELRPEFYIEGHVVNAATGVGVPEVDITVRSRIKSFAGDPDTETTDASGYYKLGPISTLPRDQFDVHAEPSELAPMAKYDQKVPDGQTTATVDFALYPALKLVGMVVGKSDQKPIVDAVIDATSRDPEYTDYAENGATEDDGKFSLELESTPFDRMFVMVSADDHGPVVIENLPTPSNDGTIDLGRIELPGQTTVSGTVVNKRTGQPVKGGDVTFSCANPPEGYADNDSESIDANGRFEIKLQYTPSSDAVAVIEATDCVELRKTVKLDPSAEVQSPLRFEVEPVVVMRGKVTNKNNGAPATGAVLQVTPAGQTAKRRSFFHVGADGSYKVQLPPDTKFDATDVIIRFGAKSFNLGPVPTPADGVFELTKDFTIDVPTTSAPIPPPRPMRPNK